MACARTAGAAFVRKLSHVINNSPKRRSFVILMQRLINEMKQPDKVRLFEIFLLKSYCYLEGFHGGHLELFPQK